MVQINGKISKYRHFASWIKLLLPIIFMMTGCYPQNDGLPKNPKNQAVTAIPNSSPTIPALSLTATKRLTATVGASTNAVPQLTPLPTLSDADADAQLLEWLKGGTDCLLPCWGGITLDNTSWSEAKQIISKTLAIRSVHEDSTCYWGPCNSIEWSSRAGEEFHGFIASQSDQTIFMVSLEGYPPPPIMRLDQILTLYGSPEKVLLFVTPTYDKMLMHLILAYPENQFVIKYVWDAYLQGGKKGNVIGCLQEGLVYLLIEKIDPPWTDDSIKNHIYSSGDVSGITLKSLSTVTNMTISDLYNQFHSGNVNECIVTPITNWLPR